MNATETRFLDTFPEPPPTLAAAASALGAIVADMESPAAVRRHAAAGLNYLFKSLDLIPDGIEDLGYLDDAFVVRVAAALAIKSDPAAREQPVLSRLAHD